MDPGAIVEQASSGRIFVHPRSERTKLFLGQILAQWVLDAPSQRAVAGAATRQILQASIQGWKIFCLAPGPGQMAGDFAPASGLQRVTGHEAAAHHQQGSDTVSIGSLASSTWTPLFPARTAPTQPGPPFLSLPQILSPPRQSVPVRLGLKRSRQGRASPPPPARSFRSSNWPLRSRHAGPDGGRHCRYPQRGGLDDRYQSCFPVGDRFAALLTQSQDNQAGSGVNGQASTTTQPGATGTAQAHHHHHQHHGGGTPSEESTGTGAVGSAGSSPTATSGTSLLGNSTSPTSLTSNDQPYLGRSQPTACRRCRLWRHGRDHHDVWVDCIEDPLPCPQSAGYAERTRGAQVWLAPSSGDSGSVLSRYYGWSFPNG
jgi:hypothetical protein